MQASFNQSIYRSENGLKHEMFPGLILALLGAHIGFILWKKYHFRSYQVATLIGLLVVPVCVCAMNDRYGFVVSWFMFCALTAIVMWKTKKRPAAANTPRLVFKFFFAIHNLSGRFCTSGCFMLLMGIFDLNFWFLTGKPKRIIDIGLDELVYASYYGVIGRDLADIATYKMAVTLGYYSADGMPSKKLDPRTCALCENALLVAVATRRAVEMTLKLTCEHVFHEFCLRGWYIVGKKSICPYCKERFTMKDIYRNPWESGWDEPRVLLNKYLGVLRYLVAWHPLILYRDHVVNIILGLE